VDVQEEEYPADDKHVMPKDNKNHAIRYITNSITIITSNREDFATLEKRNRNKIVGPKLPVFM